MKSTSVVLDFRILCIRGYWGPFGPIGWLAFGGRGGRGGGLVLGSPSQHYDAACLHPNLGDRTSAEPKRKSHQETPPPRMHPGLEAPTAEEAHPVVEATWHRFAVEPLKAGELIELKYSLSSPRGTTTATVTPLLKKCSGCSTTI